jgi:hypothetical protein
MALADHFIHRCTIQRPYDEALDAYGNGTPVFRDVATDVACRLVEKAETQYDQQRIINERAEDVIVTRYTLLLAAGVDAQERDRVVVDGRTFTIEALARRNARAAHHVTARLRLVA